MYSPLPAERPDDQEPHGGQEHCEKKADEFELYTSRV